MGVGYNQPVAQFALSDYPDANLGGPGAGSLQTFPFGVENADDFAVKVGYETHPSARTKSGTSTGNAVAVPSGRRLHLQSHRRRLLRAWYLLRHRHGRRGQRAVSPNLDIDLQLMNAANTAIDTDDPASAKVDRDIASGLDASASGSSLPSGLYYARVDGIGRGTAGTTYTDYGSVGEYTLQVTGCAVTPGRRPAVGAAEPHRRLPRRWGRRAELVAAG